MSDTYGPFTVVNRRVSTKVRVEAGASVRTLAEGVIDVQSERTLPGFTSHPAAVPPDGGGSRVALPGYPFPHLRKLSLVCEVGGTWYQGGPNSQFTPGSPGEVVLFINDPQPDDNTGGWTVTLEVTPAPESAPPAPSFPKSEQARPPLLARVRQRLFPRRSPS
jgi:hypothetical protein